MFLLNHTAKVPQFFVISVREYLNAQWFFPTMH